MTKPVGVVFEHNGKKYVLDVDEDDLYYSNGYNECDSDEASLVQVTIHFRKVLFNLIETVNKDDE